MNDTEPQQTTSGPRVTPDQMRDIDRLRRSTADRRIAGVAGGLGRHFDVDPTLIRVLLVVLAFFGGAGIWIYVAVWLLVPEDGQATAPLGVSPELRNALLATAGLVAVVIAFGSGWNTVGGAGSPVPGLVIPLLIIGAVMLFVNSRQKSAGAHHPTPAAQPLPGQPTAVGTDPALSAVFPAYAPPAVRARRGPILFWPTLALILVGWGILGTYDVGGSVADGAYAAVALAVIGLSLLVGAFRGRPGGLIFTGLLAAFALMATTFVGFTGGIEGWRDPQSISLTPASAADVPTDASFGTGEYHLDLTGVADPKALDGRHITITAKAADVSVIVPPNLNAVVTGTVDKAGEVQIGTQTRGGINPQTLSGRLGADPDNPTVYIEVDLAVGAIAVRN